MMLHTRLDTIMTGCLLALIIDLNLLRKLRQLALHPAVAFAAIVFLLAAVPPAKQHWTGSFMLPVGVSLENLAIAVILLYVVFRHESPVGKVLNSEAAATFGSNLL